MVYITQAEESGLYRTCAIGAIALACFTLGSILTISYVLHLPRSVSGINIWPDISCVCHREVTQATRCGCAARSSFWIHSGMSGDNTPLGLHEYEAARVAWHDTRRAQFQQARPSLTINGSGLNTTCKPQLTSSMQPAPTSVSELGYLEQLRYTCFATPALTTAMNISIFDKIHVSAQVAGAAGSTALARTIPLIKQTNYRIAPTAAGRQLCALKHGLILESNTVCSSFSALTSVCNTVVMDGSDWRWGAGSTLASAGGFGPGCIAAEAFKSTARYQLVRAPHVANGFITAVWPAVNVTLLSGHDPVLAAQLVATPDHFMGLNAHDRLVFGVAILLAAALVSVNPCFVVAALIARHREERALHIESATSSTSSAREANMAQALSITPNVSTRGLRQSELARRGQNWRRRDKRRTSISNRSSRSSSRSSSRAFELGAARHAALDDVLAAREQQLHHHHQQQQRSRAAQASLHTHM